MPISLLYSRSLHCSLFLALSLFSCSLAAQLNISVTGNNITCFGLANGSATAQVANGTAPFTYQWSNGGNTSTITNLNAGPYGVTVTDANGLSGSGSVTLTEPTRVTATITTPTECSGPFLIAAEPQGGQVPYVYNWSTGANTRAVSVPSGDYCVTVVDANLCGFVACTTVEENPPSVTLVDIDAQCNGSDDGAITANPSEGVAPYSYVWTTGATTQTITGLAPGVYGVTLTDARGCTATANAVISEPNPITGNIFGDNTVCPGVVDAFIRIAPQGGTAPYSYNWSPGGQTGQGIGAVGAGTYSVTVTDANECTLVDTYVVTESPEVEINITGNMLLCGAGTTGSLTVAPASGPTSQYTYVWNTGATSPTINNVGPGNFSVTATDVNGCTGIATATVRQIDLSVNLTSTSTTCSDVNDGTATVTASGGDMPYAFAWSNGATTASISGLAPGVYGVTVTEANGCKASGNVQVGAPPVLNISATPSNIACNGDNNGAINVTTTGGTPGYSYRWNDGVTSEDRTNLAAGTYGVTVTDANGCTDNVTVQINEPNVLNVNESITNVLCNGDASGSIVLTVTGGTPAYSYAWSNGATSRVLNNLTAGTYTVTVTDANECTLVESYTVTEPNELIISGTTTDVTCFGDNDGAVDLTISGGTPGYSIRWSNGSTAQDLSNVNGGTYTVTVTDANNCTETASFTINEADELIISLTRVNIDCFGDNDGSIAVSTSGGSPGYTYQWNDGPTGQTRDNLAPGVYTVTATDASGCTDVRSVRVSEPDPLMITENITNISCSEDASGSISVVVTGGTPAYSYAWSNGRTTPTINNLAVGTYTVTATDVNGCTLVESFSITQPASISITGTTNDVDCFGGNDGSINLTVVGGTPAYSWNWSNGSTSEDISNLTAGTYTVTVTDANECQETASFTINQPSDLVLTGNSTNVACAGDTNGTISISASGGTAPYTYSWSDGSTRENRDGLIAGTYTVTVTDANGCTESLSFTVSEPLALNGFTQITPVACDGDATGTINLTAERGTAPYTFRWSNGATSEDISGLEAGNYTVTITDANNCMLVQTWTVNTVTQIQVMSMRTNPGCNGASTGSVDLTVSGGSGTYAFAWSNGAITEDLTGVPAGTYSVTINDANECSAVFSYTLTEPAEIDLAITSPDIVCGGTNSGAITVFPAGGTGPYTYLWSNGDTGNMIDNIPAGSYTVTVTDANGCTDVTAGIVLGELPQLTCNVVIDQEPTTGNNGQLSVDVDGGTAPFTYAWSNGATSPTISNLVAGTYSVTITDFSGCTTECTGTLRALSGIGDFVWIDTNSNGQQDPGEPGLEDYPVFLKNAAGMIIDSTRTDADGFYAFMGLEPGTYSILFVEPQGGDRTFFNVGNDAGDNDADPSMGGMTQNYTLAPGEFNMTVDAGFVVGLDGPIVDPCNCLNNNTTNLDGQFSELFEIISGPGQTWTIVDRENMYLLESIDGTSPPETPTLVPLGTEMEVIGDATPDPVFGRRVKYGYNVRLVDSLPYTVTVSNGIQEFTVGNQCFYPEVNFVELPPAEICRFEAAFMLEGFGQLNGEDLPGTTIFTINGNQVTEIDPMTLPLGTYTITAEFVPDPPVDEDGLDFCRPNLDRTFILVDDCPAKLGDFVWQDNNGNGQQDPGEPGIEGVKVTVTSQDGTYMDMTFTDETGMYMFSVPPGTYKLTFAAPEDFVPTTVDSGNDETDSDMDPAMLMTGFYTVGPDEMNFTIDAGFISPCIANIVNPGTIGFSQEICGPGNVPEPFVELSPATGGEGEIQYLWMFNTNDPNEDISFWQPIPNSDSPNFAPGPVSETTYFTRCVRRSNCQYLESNVITIDVGDDAVASISGPTSICVGEEAIFQASNPGNGAVITWNFTGSSAVESSNGALVTTSWATFGSFSVTLTVTANGCTSTETRNIAVLNNPSRCGGNLTANGAIDNLVAREVTIEWQVPADGSDYNFSLERSTDGQNFEAVVAVTTPAFVSGNDMAMFRQEDVSPLAGRTFYRVRMIDAAYGDIISNVVEMQLAGASTSLGRIFPNPASNGMIHVEMTDIATDAGSASIQLFDVRGNLVAPRIFLPVGTGVINLPTQHQAAGVYFLRVSVGDQTETHRVIIE